MITVGYIEERDGVHYYYTRVGDTISVHSHEGSEVDVKNQMISNKASSVLILFEKFLQVDKRIIDPGKDVHIYSEIRGRIDKYIEWGHDNRAISPLSVIDNGLISTKYMEGMIKMISPKNEQRKELIFLKHSVVKTVKEPYNVE